MSSEMSREEAEGRLAAAVSGFDWVSKFLGDKTKMLNNYRVLHAQLREGDRLTLEVGSATYHAQFGVETTYPTFDIKLHAKGKDKPELVSSFYLDGCSNNRSLLYKD